MAEPAVTATATAPTAAPLPPTTTLFDDMKQQIIPDCKPGGFAPNDYVKKTKPRKFSEKGVCK
jgi:hypothetical protein